MDLTDFDDEVSLIASNHKADILKKYLSKCGLSTDVTRIYCNSKFSSKYLNKTEVSGEIDKFLKEARMDDNSE